MVSAAEVPATGRPGNGCGVCGAGKVMIMNAVALVPSLSLGFFQNFGLPEMILIGAIMLLLFGSRLPEVGKSLGRGIVEFKKGLKGVEDEVDVQSTSQPRQQLNRSENLPPVTPESRQTVGRGESV